MELTSSEKVFPSRARTFALSSPVRPFLVIALLIPFVLSFSFSQFAFAAPLSPVSQKIHNTTVRFNQGLLSVEAEGVALGVLMEEVSQKSDIAVSISPSLKDEKVSVQFEDVRLESGLKTILRSAGGVNHALLYQQSNKSGKVGQWVIEKIFLKQKGTSKNPPVPSKGSPNMPKGITSFEKEPFFDKKLDRFVEVVKSEVLVRFRKGLTDGEIKNILKEFNAVVLSKNQLKVYRLKIPADVSVSAFIEQHGENKVLELIEPNFIASTLSTQTIPPNDPSLVSQWAISMIQADKAWEVTTGSAEVVVAILDTGIEMTHPDLVNKVLPGTDIVNNDSDPSDDHGHGTHIAGIIGAEANNGLGIAGVSWASPLMPVKILTASGEGAYSDVMDGILYAADKGAGVLNLSIGGYSYSQVLGDAVAYAHTKGAVLVAAGGNEDSSDPIYPAAYPNVIGVSATDPADQIWPSSNQGAYIKLSAPGTGILSTALGNAYASATGTSASTAYVSGVGALILSKNPDFSNTQVEQILYQTADDLGAAGLDPEFGYGRLNAAKALEVASIEVHDVAVIDIRVEPQSFQIGEPSQIIVTVQNQGMFVEKGLRVSASVNEIPVEDAKMIEEIQPSENIEVRFSWVPMLRAVEQIEIMAHVETFEGESDVEDNVKKVHLNYVYSTETDIVTLYKVSPPVHQWIALQALNKLTSNPELQSEMRKYLPPDSGSTAIFYATNFLPPSSWKDLLRNDVDTSSTALIEGVWEEDEFPRPRNHFWDPDGGYNNGILDFDSNLKTAVSRFKQALAEYRISPSKGYYWLGRAAHLLMDLSVPAHVHNDQHLEVGVFSADIPENYEWYTAYNSASKGAIYKTITSASPDTSIPNIAALPNYWDLNTPSSYPNELVRLYSSLAEFTAQHDSDDFKGKGERGKYNQFKSRVELSKPTRSTATIDRISSVKWYKQTTNGNLSTGTVQTLSVNQDYEYDIGTASITFGNINKPAIYLYPTIANDFDEKSLLETVYDVLEITWFSESNVSRVQIFDNLNDTFVGLHYHIVPTSVLDRRITFDRAIGYVAALYQLFWDKTRPEKFTTLVHDERDLETTVSSTKIPLILIHGIHGNQQSDGTDGLSNLNRDYFKDFTDSFYTSSLKDSYQLFRFHYPSDQASVDYISQGLQYWINQTFGRSRPIVLLAHSMGGLVARSYITNHGGGSRTEALITLATPHHGTPLTNDEPRFNALIDPLWSTAAEAYDIAFWREKAGCSDCVQDTTHPNRSDLRWDNYNAMWGAEYTNKPREINDWLINLNSKTTYDSKIIAYYGYIGNDPMVDLYGSKGAVGMISSLQLLTGPGWGLVGPALGDKTALRLFGVMEERIFTGNKSQTIRFLYNDGLVPNQSARFTGHTVRKRVGCLGHDHLDMLHGGVGLCSNDRTLFDGIKEDLGVIVQPHFDNTPPVVSITAPLNSVTVNGISTVAANATDNINVSNVEFFLDNVRRFTDSSSPYRFSWDTTLSTNGSYSLYAIAYDGAGNQQKSATITVTVDNTIADTTKPNISSVAASTTSTTATITWITNEPANAQLEYGTSPCPCPNASALETTLTTNHSIRLTGLTPSTRYYYRVFSRDAARNRAFSNNNFFTTNALGNVAPDVVVARPNGGENYPAGSVQFIQWTATDDVGVTSVSLSYSTDGGTNWIAISGGSNIANSGTFRWTLPDISSSRVRVSVAASDGATTGSDASNGNFTISQTCTLPLIPILQSISVSGRNYSVTWDKVIGASSYILEEDTTSSFGSPIRRTLTQTSIFFSGKAAGTYFYRVKAVNSCGESALWSQVKSVAVQSNFGPGEITAVSPPDNAINQPLTVNLCWSASHAGGEGLRYSVYLAHSDTEFFFPNNIKSSGQTGRCYTAANLPYNTRISWGIKAIDDTGDSRVSPMFHFTTIADSTAPTGSIVINNGAVASDTYSVTLHLNASDTDSGVKYMRFSNDGINWAFWEIFSSQHSWNLADSKSGGKPNQTSYTVFAQFRDNQGNESATFSDTINKVEATPGNIMLNGKFYETIQDAIDAAQSGETVYLTEGTYTIIGSSKPPRYPSRSVGLVMQPGMTLMGAGAEKTRIALEGIGLWTVVDADHAVIEGLTLINSDPGGVRYAVLLESDSSKVRNTILKGSYGGINVGGGTTLTNPSNVEISNNLITGNGEGIRVNSGTNVSILHNTISHNSNHCGICANASSIIRNNIISFNSVGIRSSGIMPTVTHNDVFGSIGFNGNYVGLPNQTDINGNISADPGFINSAATNYRLSAGSAVINSGIDVGIPFMGLAPDMGAFEFGGTGTLDIISNRADAAFTITGPQSFTRSGTSTVIPNVPLGVYSITFSPISGHYSPPYQSRVLMSKQTVAFEGTYNADTSPPVGSVSVNYDEFATADPLVDMTLAVSDEVAGLGAGAEMMFSNDGVDWSAPEPYSSLKKGWDLTAFGGGTASGTRTIFVKVSDAFGNLMTTPLTDTILYVPNRNVLEVPTQFSSIQSAVDAALSGDMVYVLPGTYQENVILKTGVRLQGAGPEATILENVSSGGTIAVTAAPDTMIDGFTLKDWHNGIECQNASPIISNNVIKGRNWGITALRGCRAIIRNNFIRGGSTGIFAAEDLSIVVENNTIVSTATTAGSSPTYGIHLRSAVPATRIIATNNIIANNGVGIGDNSTGDTIHQHIFSLFNTYWDNVNGHLDLSAGNAKLMMGPGDTVNDPLFMNPGLEDFSLQASSPGIDNGHPDARYKDPDGTRNNRGAYGGQRINTSPLADFITKPATGNVGSVFVFDAGISFDKETDPSELWVRWDLDGDGRYETAWTTQKIISTQFSNVGVFTIGLQVRDKGWFLTNATKQVTVLNQPPNIPSEPLPADSSENQSISGTLGWSGGDPDPLDTVSYDVYFGTSTEPVLVSSDQPLATYNPGILNFNNFYYWRIVATDNWGNSVSGPTWRFLSETEPVPQPPGGLSAIVISDSQINLSWTDTDNEIGFKIERKTGEGSAYSQVDVVGSDLTSYGDSALSSGTSYTYRVRSYNGTGHSAYSNEASAETLPTHSADSDNDGLPDSFELAHGLNPNDPLDALLDPDGDSYTNLEEFLGGTDPRDATSLPIRPFVVETSPHDGQGVVAGTQRIPIDTSIAIRIKDQDDGIDPNTIVMTVEGIGVQNRIRIKTVNNAGFKDIWVIYDTTNPDTDNDGKPDSYEFAFAQKIDVRIEVRDTHGIAMNPYTFSFNIETQQEHDTALAAMPTVTTSSDPVMETSTIEAALGTQIAGAKILFNTAEPVTPRFGPVDEIPPLTVPNAAGLPLNLEPPTVFDHPVTIFIPAPGVSDLSLLNIYIFTPESGEWRLASGVTGWVVPGSRINHPETSPPTIEIQVNHFTGVQAAEPPSAPPTAPELVFPANEETGLASDKVIFGWNKSVDPNGDPITYGLLVCEDSTFTGCSPTIVAKVLEKSTAYATLGFVGLIFGIVMIGGVRGRKKIGLLMVSIMITAFLVASCSGGGDSGGTPPQGDPPTADMTLPISNLKSGTTYHWKVRADDGKGGISESESRSFTTFF